MCHQSVGLIARHLEAAEFPTIGLTSARTITAHANPPRSVFLDAPLGHTSGPVNDRAMQRLIVSEALTRGASMTVPGTISDLDLRWHHDEWKAAPLSWSRGREDRRGMGTPAAGSDTRTARASTPHYQSPDDRAAADLVANDVQCRTCIGLAD